MVEVKRKKGETFEGLLRRFNKRIQQSGRLYQVRKIRYRVTTKSRNERRKSALKREEIKKEKEYLRKIGRLKEEFRRPPR